jgi:hypothetical protein
MDEIICYCFGFTTADIVDDLYLYNGRSTIAATIVQAKRFADSQP